LYQSSRTLDDSTKCVIALHDNTARLTSETGAEDPFTLLTPAAQHLEPTDLHFFGSLKEAMRGKRNGQKSGAKVASISIRRISCQRYSRIGSAIGQVLINDAISYSDSSRHLSNDPRSKSYKPITSVMHRPH